MHCFDELERDHREIEQLLALLDAVASHAPDERGLQFCAFAIEFVRRFADACHHAKEEQALFPLLDARGIPRRGGPIEMMLLEHDEGRRLVAQMASALAERDPWAFVASAGAYASLLRAHIAKERGVLFPMGERRLREGDDRALSERFAAIEREAGGEALHARFHAELEDWKKRLETAPARG